MENEFELTVLGCTIRVFDQASERRFDHMLIIYHWGQVRPVEECGRERRGEIQHPIYLDWWRTGVPGETTSRTWEEIGRKLPPHKRLKIYFPSSLLLVFFNIIYC